MWDMLGDLFGYQKKEKARANVVIGALTGVLIGVAAGLLVAPQSGEETRGCIKQAAGEGYDKAKETSLKAVDFVKEKGQEVIGKFHQAKDEFEEELSEDIAKAAEELADMAGEVEEATEEVSEEAKA